MTFKKRFTQYLNGKPVPVVWFDMKNKGNKSNLEYGIFVAQTGTQQVEKEKKQQKLL